MHGHVVWITGLSGAGKSTLAAEVAERLRRMGRPVAVLDGDELRWAWGGEPAAGYDRAARVEFAMRYARLAALLSRQGLEVLVATISLFREVHDWSRANVPTYLEIYLRTPLEELRRRDPKGLYRSYDNGEISMVAGLDLAVDEPAAPDLLLDFQRDRSIESLAEAVILRLRRETGR